METPNTVYRLALLGNHYHFLIAPVDVVMEIDYDKVLPGHPPEDYKGSQSAWMVALQERGLWDGQGWYGDVAIPAKEYWEILEECEK